MNFFRLIALALTLISLMSCSYAVLNREDCLRANWYALGIQDGLAGKTASEINVYQHACLEYSVNPNQKKYAEGREKGLIDYCKLENAVTSGLKGQLYQSVCPKEIDAAFRQQNLAAYNLYLTYMRNNYYNNNYYYGGWSYPRYFGGYWDYPRGNYYGGKHHGFRPYGGFHFGVRGR